MKRRTHEILSKLLLLAIIAGLGVVVYSSVPQEQHALQPSQDDTEYIYDTYEPTYYKYSNGETGTARINPFAGVGKQITESEYERINGMR